MYEMCEMYEMLEMCECVKCAHFIRLPVDLFLTEVNNGEIKRFVQSTVIYSLCTIVLTNKQTSNLISLKHQDVIQFIKNPHFKW